MTPPENSESAPAVMAAPNWRATRDALTDLTRPPRGAVGFGVPLPFMMLLPAQTTWSAVGSSWMRDAETRAKQLVNSREPPGVTAGAACLGGMFEAPLDIGFI